MHTSMIQTSGSSPESSTGILDTRSIQSWIALVTCGTIYSTGINLVVITCARLDLACTVFPRYSPLLCASNVVSNAMDDSA